MPESSEKIVFTRGINLSGWLPCRRGAVAWPLWGSPIHGWKVSDTVLAYCAIFTHYIDNFVTEIHFDT